MNEKHTLLEKIKQIRFSSTREFTSNIRRDVL